MSNQTWNAPPKEKLVLDKKALTKWGIGALAVAAVVTAIAIYNSPGNQTERDAERHAENAPIYAQIACENAVESQLKAPSTAKFGNLNTNGSGGYYTVDGHVDAENSFGAQLRTTFVCDVAVDGESTTITDITID